MIPAELAQRLTRAALRNPQLHLAEVIEAVCERGSVRAEHANALAHAALTGDLSEEDAEAIDLFEAHIEARPAATSVRRFAMMGRSMRALTNAVPRIRWYARAALVSIVVAAAFCSWIVFAGCVA